MKQAIFLLMLILSIQAYADEFVSKVYSIETAPSAGEAHLIYFENGRVVFVESHHQILLDSFSDFYKSQELVQVIEDEVNGLHQVTGGWERMSPPMSRMQVRTEEYIPTVLNSSAAATSIFRRMRRDYQNDSQCYNRAHIWAYEEFQNSGLQSTKHFLFFTRRYIRNYNYKWWFHVSPSTLVKGWGVRILDRRYTGGHRSVSNWTRNFIYSGESCPVINSYYAYRNNQEVEDCYLIPVSMFFWQPRDIERRDRTGHEKTSFIGSEVDYAYWEAF